MQDKEYAATYRFGRTVVHIVAPPPMTEEEVKKKLEEIAEIATMIWEKQV